MLNQKAQESVKRGRDKEDLASYMKVNRIFPSGDYDAVSNCQECVYDS